MCTYQFFNVLVFCFSFCEETEKDGKLFAESSGSFKKPFPLLSIVQLAGKLGKQHFLETIDMSELRSVFWKFMISNLKVVDQMRRVSTQWTDIDCFSSTLQKEQLHIDRILSVKSTNV